MVEIQIRWSISRAEPKPSAGTGVLPSYISIARFIRSQFQGSFDLSFLAFISTAASSGLLPEAAIASLTVLCWNTSKCFGDGTCTRHWKFTAIRRAEICSPLSPLLYSSSTNRLSSVAASLTSLTFSMYRSKLFLPLMNALNPSKAALYRFLTDVTTKFPRRCSDRCRASSSLNMMMADDNSADCPPSPFGGCDSLPVTVAVTSAGDDDPPPLPTTMDLNALLLELAELITLAEFSLLVLDPPSCGERAKAALFLKLLPFKLVMTSVVASVASLLPSSSILSPSSCPLSVVVQGTVTSSSFFTRDSENLMRFALLPTADERFPSPPVGGARMRENESGASCVEG